MLPSTPGWYSSPSPWGPSSLADRQPFWPAARLPAGGAGRNGGRGGGPPGRRPPALRRGHRLEPGGAPFLYGMGVGLATAQSTNAILVDVPPEASGQASGIQSTFRQVGSALGIAVLGTMLIVGLGTRTVAPGLAEVPGLPPAAEQGITSAVRQSVGAVLPEPARGTRTPPRWWPRSKMPSSTRPGSPPAPLPPLHPGRAGGRRPAAQGDGAANPLGRCLTRSRGSPTPASPRCGPGTGAPAPGRRRSTHRSRPHSRRVPRRSGAGGPFR